jgi:hypothetical protein
LVGGVGQVPRRRGAKAPLVERCRLIGCDAGEVVDAASEVVEPAERGGAVEVDPERGGDLRDLGEGPPHGR